MSDLLKNYMRFLEEEIDGAKVIDPEIKIKDLFDYDLDETDFQLATIKFEMDELIDIPRTTSNYELSLKDLAAKIDELPRIKSTSVPSFLKKKRSQMSKIAAEMAAELHKMFG